MLILALGLVLAATGPTDPWDRSAYDCIGHFHQTGGDEEVGDWLLDVAASPWPKLLLVRIRDPKETVPVVIGLAEKEGNWNGIVPGVRAELSISCSTDGDAIMMMVHSSDGKRADAGNSKIRVFTRDGTDTSELPQPPKSAPNLPRRK